MLHCGNEIITKFNDVIRYSVRLSFKLIRYDKCDCQLNRDASRHYLPPFPRQNPLRGMFRTFVLREEEAATLTRRRLSSESLRGSQTPSLRSLPRSQRRICVVVRETFSFVATTSRGCIVETTAIRDCERGVDVYFNKDSYNTTAVFKLLRAPRS